MRFDATGLHRAFDKMSDNASKKGKDLGNSQGNFFRNVLASISRQLAPTADIIAPLIRLEGRLRRKKGVTPEQEIARRISKIKTMSRLWRKDRVESSPYRIRIWIKNLANYSGAVDNRQHPTEMAVKKVKVNFQGKLEKLAKRLTGDFNRG